MARADPVADWQRAEYFRRLEAHAEAEAAFVDAGISSYLDYVEPRYKERIAGYDGCLATTRPDAPKRCAHIIASTAPGGSGWLHQEFGFELGDIPGLTDDQFTDEQIAIILDWERVKQIFLDNPLLLAKDRQVLKEQFEHPEHHPGDTDIRISLDRRRPSYPLRSEYPGPTSLRLETTDTAGQISVSLDLPPLREVWATVSTGSRHLSINPVTLAWLPGDASAKTSQITDLKKPDTDRIITVRVRAHYKDTPGQNLFVETIELTI